MIQSELVRYYSSWRETLILHKPTHQFNSCLSLTPGLDEIVSDYGQLPVQISEIYIEQFRKKYLIRVPLKDLQHLDNSA